jgi:DNA-binding MarR family transcriptional regulator
MKRRDEHVLFWLLHHPLQRDSDLALALQIHPTTIYRHLVRLEQAGLVEYLTPRGKTARQRWYYLTNAGLRSVAAELHASPRALAHTSGADEVGLLRLIVRLPIVELLQQVINGLVAHAPSSLCYPNGERARLTWHWQRDWHHTFVSKGRTQSCGADAILVFHREPPRVAGPGEYFALLLLADGGLTGQSDHRIMEQRLERLLRYRESAERTAYFQSMPTICVLVQHQHQQERWQQAAEAVSTLLRLDPLPGAVACLFSRHRLDSAWTLPWQRLESHAPCRLQDLLLPTEQVSLPPGLFPRVASDPQATLRPQMVIRGGFAQRSEPGGSRWNQSNLPLLTLHLSEQHHALLHLIYTAPLLSTEEIAAFSSTLTPTTASRALSTLHTLGGIEREQTRCGGRWRLTSQGLRWLAGSLNVAVQHVALGTGDALMQRGLPLLKRTIQHTAGIYRFLADLHRAAWQHGHQVVWWETGSWCERRYHAQGVWHNLRPDAAFEYRVEERRTRVWLEWDEGTMTGGALGAKLLSYAQYLHSREWMREQHALPVLLIVVPEPGQEHRIRRHGAQLPAYGLRLLTTTVTRLAEQEPTAAVWLPASANETGEAGIRQSWL